MYMNQEKIKEGLRYGPHRNRTQLGSTSRSLLQQHIRHVANFVELCAQTDEQLYLELKIESIHLRKKLAHEVAQIYKDRNACFTQFSHDKSEFTVRKWRPKLTEEEREAAKDQPSKEVKVELEQVQMSAYDKVIKGEREHLNVLFEDDKCIAFAHKKPIAKTHFVVLAKEADAPLSLAEVDTKDKALLGRMTLVAAKVAA